MLNFRFQNSTEIIFGKDTQSETGQEVKKYGTKALLHFGSNRIKKNGLFDEITSSLKEAGIEYIELGGVEPNPRIGLVREGIKLCRQKSIDFILAIGGGSTIDSTKAIASGYFYDGDVWDFFNGKAKVSNSLPLGVVLTIPAAGSETSDSGVVSNPDTKEKLAFAAPCLRPKFAIMNPELTYSLPAYQTACGAADIMAHVMERYITNVKDVDFTDRLCEATLKTIIYNAPKAVANPGDYAARSEVMWAGTIAHNDLLGTGRQGDWSSHMIEHEFSAYNDVAHGAGLAVIFPAYLKYVLKHDINRMVQFAVRVMGVDQSFSNPEDTALEGIKRLKDFFKSIGLPTSLEEINVPEEVLDYLAGHTCRFDGDKLGSFVKLDTKDIRNILELAK